MCEGFVEELNELPPLTPRRDIYDTLYVHSEHANPSGETAHVRSLHQIRACTMLLNVERRANVCIPTHE